MKKRMIVMLICVLILFGAVFGWKAFVAYERNRMIHQQINNRVLTISATTAAMSQWQPKLTAVGSTRTVKGVNVTTELAGMITEIDFTPGQIVKAGQVLVELDISTDLAQLEALEATANYARITYERNLKQYKIGAVSQETLAQNKSQYESTAADVMQEKATIQQKIIKAPFTGRIGVSMVNPGQYLHPGDAVTNLETLSPIYVDFYLPQQDLPKIKVGMPVTVTVDTFGKKEFLGKITTINPMIDSDVRNVEVEATLPNQCQKLLPGMFVNVSLKTGEPKQYITLPLTAVAFNPYGNIVFTLIESKGTLNNQTVWLAHQQFVNTGAVRGNQIAVLKGINVGDKVVTEGQLKLVNGTRVIINNTITPSDNPNPHPTGE